MADDAPGEDPLDEESGDPASFENLVRAVEGRREGSAPDRFEFSWDGSEGEDDADPESYLEDLMSRIDDRREQGGWDGIDRDEEWNEGRLLPDSKSQALIEFLGGASNVLLQGPLLCPADYEVDSALMGIEEDDPINLLLVTFSMTTDERLGVLQGFLEEPPERTAIVEVGSQTRSSDSNEIETSDGSITIDTVPDPADLRRLGITIDKALSRWREDDRRTVLCFHSVTALLQFVDEPRRIFRFLNILRGRIRSMDAHAHYHIEDGVHDAQLIRTLRPVFDAVVTYDDRGSISVET